MLSGLGSSRFIVYGEIWQIRSRFSTGRTVFGVLARLKIIIPWFGCFGNW